MSRKAPKVTSFNIKKLAANYLQLEWDDVGSNFYYIIEYRVVANPNNPTTDFQFWGFTDSNNIWIDSLSRNTYYQFRIRSAAPGFEQSDWNLGDVFQTFSENAYNITNMRQFRLSSPYIQNRLANNDKFYLDFNEDALRYSIMRQDFSFDSSIANMSNFADKIVRDEEKHLIQGYLPVVCRDMSRVDYFETNGVMYALERYQNVAKVSNDGGQNWITYQAFSNRVGNPVANTTVYQNSTNTYVLGYDRIFQGISTEELKWSSEVIRFSSVDATFADLSAENEIGFPVEIFGEYARIPESVSRIAEAMACDDSRLYVAARNNIRFLDLIDTPIDNDPQSEFFGLSVFDDEVIPITSNPYAVVKKLDCYDGDLYALVTGEVDRDEGGNRFDPTDPENILESDAKGVYKYTTASNTFVRVFGNTEEERDRINHKWTDFSTNGREVFFDVYDYRSDDLIDEDLPLENDNVTAATKYDKTFTAATTKKKITSCLRSTNGEDWNFGPYEYYNETKFSWLARNGDRTWKTNDNRGLTVYSVRVYTFNLDNTSESFSDGVWTMKAPNINFDGLEQYSAGVAIHKTSGELVGYFEFPFRTRENFEIFWRPDETILTAELAGDVRIFEQEETTTPKKRDVTVDKLISKMTSEAYVEDESTYKKFIESYLMFVSEGDYGFYHKMLNLVKNTYPKEPESQKWLMSEIKRRNIYLDNEKREQVVRFFESRAGDFYSSKGTIASYEFLFKLLYNVDVELEIESKNNFEYDILVDSDNITQDIVGTPIRTNTGFANATYIEREYNPQGKLLWRVTIHNFYGKFYEGQNIESERFPFDGVIVRNVSGKQLPSDSREYLDRGRSLYVMKIKSELPTSWYKEDVLRFVHPVGFGFVGITMITVLINSGISLSHLETIVNRYKALRFDMGVPNSFMDEIPDLDINLDLRFDQFGDVITKPNPLAGTEPEVPIDYDTTYDENWGLLPSERRRDYTPTWDSTWARYSNLFALDNLRLKDNIGNPYDPSDPQQVKVDE